MRVRTVLLLVAMTTAITPAAASADGGSPIIRPIFEWEMQERFGLDADADGLIDALNTEEYVHNRLPGSCPAGCGEAHFQVAFDGTASTAVMGGEDLPIVSYRWTVTLEGDRRALHYTRATPVLRLLLPEGSHSVALTVTARLSWGTAVARSSQTVTVEDLLIVTLGDSYASGEGNPETSRSEGADAQWADGAGDDAVGSAHAAAHRSTLAWPAQAALVLERSDPHTSVTFISLAASGATIHRGLLGARAPASVSQVEAAARMVRDREVDLVLLSVGGNDIGFARMVRGLVEADPLFDPICYETHLSNIWLAVQDGDWNRTARIDFRLGRPWELRCRADSGGDRSELVGLSGLPAALERAAEEIDQRLDPRAVYLAEYPDPSGLQRDGDLGSCGEIVGDVTPPFTFHEISRAEQEEGRLRMLEPLNAALADVAARHGWVYMDGISDAFLAGHGYCADWPDYGYPDGYTSRPSFLRSRLDFPEGWYRNPGVAGPVPPPGGSTTSWYRSAAQSAALEGPDTRFSTTGTLHPNELGHRAIAEILLAAYLSG